VTAESAREFFDGLAGRVSPQGARALEASYRFDIDGAGSWRVESEGDRLVVGERHFCASSAASRAPWAPT
jgi:hypothetical protein